MNKDNYFRSHWHRHLSLDQNIVLEEFFIRCTQSSRMTFTNFSGCYNKAGIRAFLEASALVNMFRKKAASAFLKSAHCP
jgi:hypothetical protein